VIATNGELTTSAPLARGLPALYREPDPRTGDAGTFVRRFTDGLDGVLAPVFAALDNLPAYFDPKTAPEHFLDWLAAWVGLELFEKWSPDLRRTLVAGAVELHSQRGTKAGIQRAIAIFAEVDVDHVTIEESGDVWGVSTIALDDDPLPEFPAPVSRPWMRVTVRLGADRAGEVANVRPLVRRVAERVKPAHVALVDPRGLDGADRRRRGVVVSA
jgi:phage tail-like protein